MKQNNDYPALKTKVYTCRNCQRTTMAWESADENRCAKCEGERIEHLERKLRKLRKAFEADRFPEGTAANILDEAQCLLEDCPEDWMEDENELDPERKRIESEILMDRLLEDATRHCKDSFDETCSEMINSLARDI